MSDHRGRRRGLTTPTSPATWKSATARTTTATWFAVGTASGAEQLVCNDEDTSTSNYTTAELALVPYTCSTAVMGSPSWNTGLVQTVATGEVTTVDLTSLMADNGGGDDAQLYRYEVWVR